MGVITAAVPTMSRRFLEENYAPLNHASNSETRDHTFEQQRKDDLAEHESD